MERHRLITFPCLQITLLFYLPAYKLGKVYTNLPKELRRDLQIACFKRTCKNIVFVIVLYKLELYCL